MALYYAHQQLIWIRQLLQEMGLDELVALPTVMFADSNRKILTEMARAGAGSNRGPSDPQILQAMRSTHAKQGDVCCIRYMVRVTLAAAAAAESLADEMTECELQRLESDHSICTDGVAVELAQHQTLKDMSRCSAWFESRQPIGLAFHRYYVGVRVTINEQSKHMHEHHGAHAAS